MGHRQSSTFTTIAFTLALVLLLTSCSRITLGYRNLHLVVPWTLNDYVTLTSNQKRDLRALLREHRDWHCSTMMPEHLDWLDRLLTERVDQDNLRSRLEEGQAAISRIAERITPSIIEQLKRLSDEQVEEIRQALQERQQERVEEFLEPSLDEQIQERAERMRERTSDWFGSLNANQRQRILQWSHTLDDANSRWVDNRDRWDDAFIQALEQRHSDDFTASMTRLIQDRRSFWTEEYRERFARNEQAGLDLAVDLYSYADEPQRQHLAREIRKIREDLAGLDCIGQI